MPRGAYVEPPSRLALWSLRLVLFGVVIMIMVVASAWADVIDGAQAIVLLAIGAAFVAIGVLVALAAGVSIWISGYRGARNAVFAVIIGLFALSPAAMAMVQGYGLPMINDITTDPDDPPAYDVVATARPRSANPTAYPPGFAPLQRSAYPLVRPLTVELAPDDVADLINDFLAAHRWRVLDRVDYAGPGQEGRVEMVTRSLVMGFRDDIVIRIREVNGRVRIDMRSSSRYGRHDFGANARRIEAAMDELRIAARRAQTSR